MTLDASISCLVTSDTAGEGEVREEAVLAVIETMDVGLVRCPRFRTSSTRLDSTLLEIGKSLNHGVGDVQSMLFSSV